MTEENKKRIHLETLQKLKDLAGRYPIDYFSQNSLYLANDALDITQLTIDDLKKAIDVPKELRSNQSTLISYQMDEIRKLVREISFDYLSLFQIDLDRRINRYNHSENVQYWCN
jgi:hypothetical protein